MRVEHLVAGHSNLSDAWTIVIVHRLMPIDARCNQGIEIGDVSCIQFQKAPRITLAPPVKGAALEHDDLVGTGLDVDCLVYLILRYMRSNGGVDAAARIKATSAAPS